jgi:hypothetical protein
MTNYPVIEIAIGGLPKPEDLDSNGYCWWGWAANHLAANIRESTWEYAKPPGKFTEKATHWASAGAVPDFIK